MKIQRAGIFFFLILVVAFSSCEPNNPFDTGPPYDFEGNLAKDSLLIVDYLDTAQVDSLYRIHDPSGVVIIVQEEGAGSRPVNGNVVYADYTGSLMSDGTVFDTSVESVAMANDLHVEGDEYRPIRFLLGGGTVISGWSVSFRRLRPGSKARLVIPSPYGYQNVDRDRIPANSVLIFDVDFLGIE
ncbi:FKBP-type peptidyl-prolyl cis-trans isomerase [Algoriphagus halophytocola]|uniref:FKBP-type peptidyl-prolyl cis-trans isomerase n=1 Tax=Algoriphagus halophytocola TaxID=2991499 RepID=UPI0022DD0803|nr:FKBP-type peptidyl-prolyl cis-trans isomerase [Algoriphagus sp. TR-M9]WBL42684.1 FKBP-type peptidyl-prolyl cis-trans isomerase [Algoriphagus sp. TR-M9]